jgi:hypothetical protein
MDQAAEVVVEPVLVALNQRQQSVRVPPPQRSYLIAVYG